MQCNAEDVFINENARVGDFMREASAVLRILYPPLSNFNATRLWIEGALCGENDDTPMRNFTRGQRQQTTKMVPVLVELEGVGMDMGQPEVDIVRCSCGCVSPPLPPPPTPPPSPSPAPHSSPSAHPPHPPLPHTYHPTTITHLPRLKNTQHITTTRP